ncbi:NADPH-dependent FMN reductase [Kineosporia succinea]|uniref:NAD(P)H-dependent FMN reductase n=1 Tax=Kineosporia succinea TaxID=84632 RepID=A0ABT9NW42_9ACTN|nr:NAD(P)H-dependent oxidoreductase [Kineosporia succinea]MDP9824646.1 NAD(P)H-dependent FMN reductase [Kineosporia succinea]
MKIGIIVGSVRDGARRTEAIAKWVLAATDGRTDAEFELIDLKAFDVPLLTSSVVPAAAGKKYESANVQRWSEAVDAVDGFIFVTPEYNHGVPGAFKNAFDSLGAEWASKPVGFVSFGADGGIRAVEQWRQIVANFHMVDVRAQVALSMFFDVEPSTQEFAPMERRQGEVAGLLEQLVASVKLHSQAV